MKVFDNKAQPGSLMEQIALYTGTKINDGKLVFPEKFGKGYIKTYELGKNLKVILNEFELKKNINVKRRGEASGKEFVTFSFRNLFYESNTKREPSSGIISKLLPSVQVTSGGINVDVSIPAKVKMNTILVIVNVNFLKELFQKKTSNKLLQKIINSNQAYLYEELISPEMQNTASQIFNINAPQQLVEFYIKVRAEELIYLFFVELLKRQNISGYPLNINDVKTIYIIRDKIVQDLSIPPNLDELTEIANMSESKMNRLFKQIFGSSIYNYYQTLRLNEAAYLIREHKLSISEVGYKLGFTNLSHFSRIFEKQHGITPKKYSLKNKETKI